MKKNLRRNVTLMALTSLALEQQLGTSLSLPLHDGKTSPLRASHHVPFMFLATKTDLETESSEHLLTTNRRVFMASVAAAGAAMLLGGPEQAYGIGATNSDGAPFPWEASPVNRRSGVTVFDAEKAGYNVAFVTYLSRFLLNFDGNCQRYWFSLAKGIPTRASEDEVEQIRIDQFAAFAASIELGLIAFEGKTGPERLLNDLVEKYGKSVYLSSSTREVDIPSRTRDKRLEKSARRHIALLFGLMDKNQPTQALTRLLASVDNGSISSVRLSNETVLAEYEVGEKPLVTFNPPQAGDTFETAKGRAILKPSGSLLRVDVLSGGSGYSRSPRITVSPPSIQDGGTAAQLQANLVKGSVESVEILNPGKGYTDKDRIHVTVSQPDEAEGKSAVVSAVLSMVLDRIDITKPGSGYAIEKPLKVFVTPPRRSKTKEPGLAGFAYPTAERSSFSSFRKDDDLRRVQEEQATFDKTNLVSKTDEDRVQGEVRVSGIEIQDPSLPFWTASSSSSSELLRLLPAGVGLEYDIASKRYVLAMDTIFMSKYPTFLAQGSSRLIGTDFGFGPRGRVPIERDMSLGASAYLRFCLSGAICTSLVNVPLTFLDVTKTRLQTAPDKYPDFRSAFQRIYREEGATAFFTGWLPTLLGSFVSGGVLYVTTEFIRRLLTEAAGVDAISLEVPIILTAAVIASAFGAVLICPFEAVRIRTVAQRDFAPNSIGVLNKIIDEEGVDSLFNAIPIFLVRNVPYAMTKFTIFDISTERLYEAFPVALEDIKLSLLISLVGGVLGGTAAACVSNPADAVISELKKSKSDITPQEAVSRMLERNGISTFFVGLPVRIVFYSLVSSLTFAVYDFLRFLLGVGPDDLTLYLDVLGGSLGNSS